MSIGFGLLCVLALGGCGQNRDLPPPPPLKAEWYVIDESDRPARGQFLRYAAPGATGGGLDIAITDYAPATAGPTVHLVGVVHVADAPYYEAMQRELDGYDKVLYEGVKPASMKGVEWQKGMLEKSGDLGKLQQEIADWFGFRYQMEALDYSRANLVHADMSLEEFAAADTFGLVEKPEPAASAGVGGSSSAAPSATPTGAKAASDAVLATWASVRGLGHVALGEDGPLRSLGRKMFAETMGTVDIGTSLDFLPGLSELILIKRNRIVLDRLKEERATTKGRIAIFYGAAHMNDLEKHLESEFGYHRTGGRWLRAWALRPPIR